MSRLPTYSEEQVKVICGSFAKLSSGMYEVSEAFDSPFHDGRCRYGHQSYKRINRGERIAVEVESSPQEFAGHILVVTQYTVRFHSWALVSFQSWEGNGKVSYSFSGSLSASDRKALRFLELLLAQTAPLEKSTVGSLLGGEVAQYVEPRGVLAVLVESGKLSLDALQGAIEDWSELGQEEADDLYDRHGLNHLS